MKKHIILLLTGIISLSAFAQTNFKKNAFTATDGTRLNYRELTPIDSDKNEKYPLVLFLHGAGERGSDNEKQLTHGSGMFENPVNREKYPAYVLFPQCPEDGYWAYPERPKSFNPDSMPMNALPTPLITALREMIENYTKRPEIDKNRVYIIGLSMGGMATYDIAGRYPELFTAAIPICGTVNPQRLEKAKDVKFRIYHGDADNVVPVAGSREAYLKLKSIGADVEYFEFPGVNHGSWNPAFNQQDFLEWLFKQNKTENDSNEINLD